MIRMQSVFAKCGETKVVTQKKTFEFSCLSRPVAIAIFAALAGVSTAWPVNAQTKLILQAANQAPSIGSEDFYVAQYAGFLKEEGLEVEVRYAANASQAAQIVGSGGADLGRFAFDPALNGYYKGLRLRSFYQFYRRLIYYVAIPEQSPLKTIEDLRGKKVAVVNMGSAAVGVFRSMLRQAQMPLDSVNLIPIGKADAAIAAYRTGSIDAFMYWNEVYSSMIAAGEKLRFIRHPRLDIGNGYFASEAGLKDKRAALQGFARAIAKASVFIRANPEAAARIYLTVNPEAGSGQDAATAVKRIADQLRFWSDDWVVEEGKEKYGENDLKKLQLYALALHEEGSLEKIPPVEDLITNELIAGANNFDLEKVRAAARNWK